MSYNQVAAPPEELKNPQVHTPHLRGCIRARVLRTRAAVPLRPPLRRPARGWRLRGATRALPLARPLSARLSVPVRLRSGARPRAALSRRLAYCGTPGVIQAPPLRGGLRRLCRLGLSPPVALRGARGHTAPPYSTPLFGTVRPVCPRAATPPWLRPRSLPAYWGALPACGGLSAPSMRLCALLLVHTKAVVHLPRTTARLNCAECNKTNSILLRSHSANRPSCLATKSQFCSIPHPFGRWGGLLLLIKAITTHQVSLLHCLSLPIIIQEKK